MKILLILLENTISFQIVYSIEFRPEVVEVNNFLTLVKVQVTVA